VGRRASISYADARFGRRWLSVGSEIVSVHRRRRVVFGGRVNGRVVGMGFVICEGIGFDMAWLRASAE